MPLTFDKETIDAFAQALREARKVVLVAHKNPDGDAVGSLLGSYQWLTQSFFAGGKCPEITLLLPNPCPEEALYLPGADRIQDADHDKAACERALAEADLIWGVDFNNGPRIEPLDAALLESGARKILCDHHHNPDGNLFPTLFSVPDLSSTCELLYWIFVQTLGEDSITDDVARCLYHGINTDTGNFSYACEDPSLYEAVAALMKHPIHAAEVHNRIFNNYSFRKMRLLAFLLHERLKIFEKERFAYFYIDARDIAELGVTEEELEGIVNYTLMMKEIQVGVMVKETRGQTRLSFRSKNHFDVNTFARRYFGGGGHTQASGATSPFPFQKTLEELELHMLEEIRKFNDQ